jgi:transposase
MLSRWRKEYREGKIVADKRKKVTEVSSKQAKELSKVKRLETEFRIQGGRVVVCLIFYP